MALPQETPTNLNINDKDMDPKNKKLEEGLRNPKKKFYNTVFAKKMRNKKKEEKLKNLNPEEVLTSCKSVSGDVSRVNTNGVSKLITTAGHKIRRRRKSQWALGSIPNKKKKSNKNSPAKSSQNRIVAKDNVDKQELTVENDVNKNKNDVGEQSNIEEKNEGNGEIKISTIRTIQHKLKIPKRNLRLNSDKDEMNFDSTSEESFSCSRTKPFTGKLNTRQARLFNIKKMLKEEFTICGRRVSLFENSKEHGISIIEESGIPTTEDNKQLNTCASNECAGNEQPSDKQLSEQEELSTISQKSQTKDNETSCSRTVPFVGKNLRKHSSGTSKTTTNDSNNISQNTSSISETLELKNKQTTSSINVDVSDSSILQITDKNLDSSIENSDKKNLVSSEDKISSPTITKKVKKKNKRKSNSSLKVPENEILSSSINIESENSSFSKDMNLLNNKSHEEEKTNLNSECNDSESTLINNDSDILQNESVEKVSNVITCARTMPYSGKNKYSKRIPFPRVSSDMKEPNTNVDIVNTSLMQEPIHNISHITNTNQLIDESKQSTNENIQTNCIDNSTHLNITTENDLATQNGEWKFRRKRQKTSSDREIQHENKPTKKFKINLSLSSKALNKSLSVPSSPGSTICSLLSIKCTKHAHDDDHQKYNGTCLELLQKLKQASVVLHKLENMKDSLVLQYLEKTETDIVKNDKATVQPKIVPVNPNLNNNESKDCSLNNQELQDSSLNKQESLNSSLYLKPASVKSSASQEQLLSQVDKNTHDAVTSDDDSFTTGRSLRSGKRRTSLESSISIRPLRRKRGINYLDSDSDSDATSISTRLRTTRSRIQSESSPQRGKRCSFPNLNNNQEQDEEDTDMEVAEFSRIGSLRRRNQSSINESVNSNDSNDDEDKEVKRNYVTRSRSRAAGSVLDNSTTTLVSKESTRPKTVLEKRTVKKTKMPTRSKTPSLSLKNKEALNPPDEPKSNELEKSVEQTTVEAPKTPVPDQQHKSNDTITSEQTMSADEETPISQASTIVVNQPGRTSRASLIDDNLLETPKKACDTPNQRDLPNSDICLETPLKTAKRPKSNLFGKIPEPEIGEEGLPSTSSATEDIPLRNLKVQLIKLEAICAGFKDLSASEIELLTTKYIDLLMNSNFTCDTWRRPINYHRPPVSLVELVDNSDCVSDHETPDDSGHVTSDEDPKHTENVERNAVNLTPRKQSLKKSDHQQGLSARVGQLSEQPGLSPSGQRNESTSQSALRSETDVAINQTASLNDNNSTSVTTSKNVSDLSTSKQNEQSTSTDNCETREQAEPTNEPETLTVNGLNMFKCEWCEKIFINKDFLSVHVEESHPNATKEGTEVSATSDSSKSSAKQEPIGSKKPCPKSKKKIKPRNTVQSLQCSVCSQIFATTEELWSHLKQHNEHELQSAYKKLAAKLNTSDTALLDQDQSQKTSNNDETKTGKKKRKSVENVACSSRSSVEVEEIVEDSTTAQTLHKEQQVTHQTNVENYLTTGAVPIVNSTTNEQPTPLMMCYCHAHETAGQDLQIEMVLQCKSCNVIYRRRECFETHYRTNSECRQRRQNNEMTKVPKLFCSGCPCVLDSLLDMRSHLEMHALKNSQGSVTFVCNICKVAFFGVGSIFYSHWFNHTKTANFVASKYSFPKLSVVSVLEDSNISMTQSKSQEGFFYIAEHVCRQCRLPFSSEPELQKHKETPCQPPQPKPQSRVQEIGDNIRTQMIKLICDLCKKYYVNKEGFDKHCVERNHLKTPLMKFSRLPVNNNEQTYVCSLCRKLNKTLEDLMEHWKRVHSPIMELYTCKTCNVVPSNDVANYTYEKFELHCRAAHKSEVITCLVYFVTARYVCNLCKYAFESEKSLREHQVVHQKKPQAPLPGSESQTVPLWVTDNVVSEDGRQIPVSGYVQYQVNIAPKNVTSTTQAAYHQQQQPIFTPSMNAEMSSNPGYFTGPHSSNMVQTPSPNTPNNLLRNLLASNAFAEMPQTPQPPAVPQASPNIETIFLDSRSNSPVTDIPASAPTYSTAIASSGQNAASDSSTSNTSQKSYMTMVNPDFETMLGSNGNKTSSSVRSPAQQDKEALNAVGDNDTDMMTPQPFEIVLVTDELGNENSSEEIAGSNKTTVPHKSGMTDNGIFGQYGPTSGLEMSNDSSSSSTASTSAATKSFLRVRSIAELQQIKILLCSECGLSFNTTYALADHKRTHDIARVEKELANVEVGRETPVQKISPMPMQSEPVNTNSTTQHVSMRHKMPVLTSNGQSTLNDMNARARPSTINSQSQPQIQQQQQQVPNYWFASCNGSNNVAPPNVTYNTYNTNRQNPSILRRQAAANAAANNYTSVRGPPPSYSAATQSAMSSSRTAAIHLPERNATNSNTPATKRPSGAATRIPQLSLPHFDTLAEHRPMGGHVSYNTSEDSREDSASINTQHLSTIPRSTLQFQGKTYNRVNTDPNYGDNYNHNVNYNSHLNQAPQHQKVMYSCKYPPCTFQSDNPRVIRTHEKIHVEQSQQQQQQQRVQVKHVSVSQMPERQRHAVPSSRATTDKRYSCRLCHMILNSPADVTEHLATVHAPSSQVCCYVCDYCKTPLIFKTEALLREHMNIAHNFSCEICKKRYPSKEDLMLHMDVHTRHPC